MREALFRQRKLVEDLKQDLADGRALAGLRYGALQKQIEKTAESAEGGGGLFGDVLGGIGDIAGGLPIVGGIVEGALDMVTGEGEPSQADQLREGAARDAYEREQREEQDLTSRLMSAISTLESMQRDYTERSVPPPVAARSGAPADRPYLAEHPLLHAGDLGARAARSALSAAQGHARSRSSAKTRRRRSRSTRPCSPLRPTSRRSTPSGCTPPAASA
jgi:hypothetical protein